MTETKVDIVIQGEYTDYTDEIIELYLTLPFVNNIIVSCWEDNRENTYYENIIFVRNKYPESPGTDNRNLQIVSSLNGLKKCQSQFSIKTRSDQKFTYESMMNMYDFFIHNNQKSINYQYESDKPYNKIMVAGIFSYLLFCPRDHMFWGRTEDLVELFDIPLEKNGFIEKVRIPKQRLWMYYDHFIRTETYIGVHYCSKFNEELYRMILNAHDYLHDGSIYWYHSKGVSNNITPLVFKSFPKSMIYFDWPCKPDFTVQSYIDACSWHEDGF